MKNIILIMILLINIMNNIEVNKKKHKKSHHKKEQKNSKTQTGCKQDCEQTRFKKNREKQRELQLKVDIARVEEINKIYQHTKVKQMIESLRLKQKALQGYSRQQEALNEKQIILTSKADYVDYKLDKLKEAQFEKENEEMIIKDKKLAEESQQQQKQKKRLRKHRKH